MIDFNLIRELNKHLPVGKSLNETISEVLDISYDAAHRRASGKSKFSLEEGITLSKHFGISLDKLFKTDDRDFIAIEKTIQIHNEEDLATYYSRSFKEISAIPNLKECQLLYSAKDIPIFYTLNNETLNRFKSFVWLKILDTNFSHLTFDKYTPIPQLNKAAKNLGSLYDNFKRTEIWDITTINSLLKQIHFYFLSQELSHKDALLIANELRSLVLNIEKQITDNTGRLSIYHNELLLMNNSVLIKNEHIEFLYTPFTMLSYYKTNDKKTYQEAEAFLQKQLGSSKLLNTSGAKEQKTFFNKIYGKIDALEQLIKASLTLDFQ